MHNHTNASRRLQRAMQTILCKRPLTTYNLYENVTAVRRTLQRKATYMCTPATIAYSTWSSPQNECQLVDILYYLLAASTCCHHGCHRCDTVIHACLQPTRALCLKVDLKFCVRPSGARLRPHHVTKSCYCG